MTKVEENINSMDQEQAPDNSSEQFIAEELEPMVDYTFGTTSSLYEPDDVREALGFDASIPAEIDAGRNKFYVVDIRSYSKKDGYRSIPVINKSFNTDFILISPTIWRNSEHKEGFKGLRVSDYPMVVGRDGEKTTTQRLKLAEDDSLSREHFALTLYDNNSINIVDLNSTNGTYVTALNHGIYSGRTGEAVRRLKNSIDYRPPDAEAPNGYYKNLHIIGKNSPAVDRGVYLGGSSREAIAVDSDHDPALNTVYRDARKLFGALGAAKRAIKQLAGQNQPNRSQNKKLEDVVGVVQKHMKYEGDRVDEISKQYYGDKVVPLGEFVANGVGVCRHQALLAAFLVEKLVQDGFMAGHVRVERNTIPEYGGTHAWAVFTDEKGQETVLDPAQSFVGTKKEARKKAGRWDYYLPVEPAV